MFKCFFGHNWIYRKRMNCFFRDKKEAQTSYEIRFCSKCRIIQENNPVFSYYDDEDISYLKNRWTTIGYLKTSHNVHLGKGDSNGN